MDKPKTIDVKFNINKNIIIQESEDRILLFDSENSYLYTLNTTAAFIFKQLQKKTTLQTTIEELMSAYKVEEIVAKKDLNNLLLELKLKKIII